jgi:hypothetical protein
MGKPGKREYVQVLRLLESFDLEELTCPPLSQPDPNIRAGLVFGGQARVTKADPEV